MQESGLPRGALNIRTMLADLRSNAEEAETRDQIRDISRELFVDDAGRRQLWRGARGAGAVGQGRRQALEDY